MMASALALQTLMDALVSTAAKMAAEQEARAFESGLARMRAEYKFADFAQADNPVTYIQTTQAVGAA